MFKSRPGPVQFANSDICTQTRSCHSGGCFDPENAKVSTELELACLLRSNFNSGSNQTTPLKLEKVITQKGNFGNSIPLLGMFDNHCGGLQFRWCLCMQNLDKSSNMRSLDRFTLWCRSVLPRTNLFPLFRKMSKIRLRDTPGIGLKDCFFGRCSGAEFKMGEMRGRWCQSVIYCRSQWYYTPNTGCLSDIIRYRLPASVLLYTYTGCQSVCDLHTYLLTVQSLLDNIGCWLPSV